MLMADEVTWTRVVLAGDRAAPSRPDRIRQTVHRILAGSLGTLLVLILVGYLAGAQLAERQALADAERFTRLIGDSVVGPYVTPALLRGDPQALRRLDRVLAERLLGTTSIRRVKVWSPTGAVLYSDDHTEIGQSFRLSPEERGVLGSDGAASAVSSLGQAENAAERALGSPLIEVYTAVRAADGRPVLFEAYLGFDEVKERRATVFTLLSALGAVLLVVFALFQVGLSLLNLRWLRRRQADLEQRTAELSDRARRRVARDLHDGVVQDLVGTAYLVDGARATARSGDVGRADRMLATAADGVRTSLKALRCTLIEVYPVTLNDRGLGPALEDLVQPLRTRGLQVVVEDRTPQPLPGPALEATYRAAQEAVRNVGRHAHASTLLVRVQPGPGRLCLTVRDDGVGLDPARLPVAPGADGHLGLQALADAAREQGGRLEIRTAPGLGTELRWEVPL